MNEYWESVWAGKHIKDYENYINLESHYDFIDLFKRNKVSYVCDAACGFGKYSAILSKNKFKVSGFDISEESVKLTQTMLDKLHLGYVNYLVCSITDISYPDEWFDGVVAHAVLDHLMMGDAVKALDELFRISRQNGVIYLSFDGLEDDDIETSHDVLGDGSFRYTDKVRQGMIFKYYTDGEIEQLVAGHEIVYFNLKQNGEREIVLRKT